MCRVEIVLNGVVICWSCNNNEICILICCFPVKSSCEVQRLLCQIFLDIIVLDRRNTVIEFLYLFCNYIYCCNMMVLRQQGCYTQTNVASTGYCYSYIFKIIHIKIYFLVLHTFSITIIALLTICSMERCLAT